MSLGTATPVKLKQENQVHKQKNQYQWKEGCFIDTNTSVQHLLAETGIRIAFLTKTHTLEKVSNANFWLNSPGLSFVFQVSILIFSNDWSKSDPRIILINRIWAPKPQTAIQRGTGLKREVWEENTPESQHYLLRSCWTEWHTHF